MPPHLSDAGSDAYAFWITAIWQETPRERLDAFFQDWVEQLVAGNPPYSAMTGDEVYNAMVDWCTES